MDEVRRARWWFAWSVLLPAALAWVLAYSMHTLGIPAEALAIFLRFFTYHDLPGAVLWASLALLCLALAPRLPTERVAEWVAALARPRTLAVIAAGTAIAFALGAFFAYHRHALALDESAQLFQARAFAAGRLTGQVPPALVFRVLHPSFINAFWSVEPTSGRVIANYWPGFAALMAPAARFGVAWLVNPLLGALALVQLAWLVRQLGGSAEASGWAVLLGLASPQLMAQGISYYSMTAHQLVNLGFAGLLLVPTPRRLFLAGLLGSLGLVLHQPTPHAAFAIPWLLWLTFGSGLAGRRRHLLWLAAGYLPALVGVGLGWFALRSQFQAEWAARFGGTEMAPADTGPLALALRYAAMVFHLPGPLLLQLRLMELCKLALWAVPGLLAWAVAGFAGSGRGSAARRLGWSFLSLTGVYLLVQLQQGHGWGARYLAPAYGTLFVLAALEIPRRADGRAWRGLALTAVVCGVLVAVPFRALQIESFIACHLAQLPPRVGPTPRLVFISPHNGYYKQDLLQNDPFLRGRELMLEARSPELDANLARHLLPGSRRLYFNGSDSVWSVPAPPAGSQLPTPP